MVTTAFLLLTVSTLAAQINAVPTDNFNDPCEGKTHCFEKPPDYPQEMMDRLVAQSDLNHLHRIKRETQLALKNHIESEKNECVDTIGMRRMFKATDEDNMSRNVVQSALFNQLVPEIKCRTNKICFEKLRIGCFKCKPRTIRVSLLMANKDVTEVKMNEIDIDAGCGCDNSSTCHDS